MNEVNCPTSDMLADDIFSDFAKAISESGRVYDIDKLYRAYKVAAQMHSGQRRHSGEPYIIHPVATAKILLELGMDTDTLAAALLHDVVEDTETTKQQLEDEFGTDVALMVDGVTKLTNVPFLSRERKQAENVRKMLFAMARDVRVIIIKLADRLHNMRTLEYHNEEKRRIKALETMEVYAPLAHRLGMSTVKTELEDIAIHYLDPIGCEEIERSLTMRKQERKEFVDSIISRMEERLKKENIKANVFGRVKSMYGIYRKEYMSGRDFSDIYDIYAVRVIVDTVMDCYNVLGVVHDMMRPIPDRFKDYISTPKQNMYQSLHTTLVDSHGIPFEVQIRTWEMHYTAEYGVAAHWKYKIGKGGKDSIDDKLVWIRKLLEANNDYDDAEDVVKSIKTDMAADEVYIFTPKGDVKVLPQGSTVLDFAYSIHSAVGNRTVGAKVNGRMVSLDFVLSTGMICEIVTGNSTSGGPSRDWLKIVTTTEAKSKIRAWFKKERREENILEGRQAFEKELRHSLIVIPEKDLPDFLNEQVARHRLSCVDDFYASIGYGGISLQRIMPKIKEEFYKKYRTVATSALPQKGMVKSTSKNTSSGVIVEGLDGCLVKFAKCCTPLPGDDIIGFVTRGYGVSVHNRDCVNVRDMDSSPERWVSCTWAKESSSEIFHSTIEVIGEDRSGILADVSAVLCNMRLQIHSLFAREIKDNRASIQITIGIRDVNQLNSIMKTLGAVSGVLTVNRLVQ